MQETKPSNMRNQFLRLGPISSLQVRFIKGCFGTRVSWTRTFFIPDTKSNPSAGGRKVGTHQGNCEGQLALVATTVGACHMIDVIMKPNCFNKIVDNLLHILAGDTLQAGIHVEMLPGCHEVQQWVELGAVSHLLLCRSEVTRHRMPVYECITPRRLQITTQD
jgi:hypothetical protein